MLTDKSSVNEIVAAWDNDWFRERRRAIEVSSECEHKEWPVRMPEIRVLATDADGGNIEVLTAFIARDRNQWVSLEEVLTASRLEGWIEQARDQRARILSMEGHFVLVNPANGQDCEATGVWALVEIDLTEQEGT
jgi:hypothetical protein